MARVTRIAAAISELCNAAIGGHNNETLSGRAYRRRHKSKRGAFAYKWINRVFFWQKDHCFHSHLDDRIWHRSFGKMIEELDRESGFFMPDARHPE